MITNPVLKREMRVSQRSIRLPIIISIFNLILAIFILVSMSVTIGQAKEAASVNYATFLTIFRYVAALEFCLLLFIMPALTAGSISSEREHRTLDLMLASKLTPASIVTGKLLSTFTTMILLVISSLPILVLAFAYGGITFMNVLNLLLTYAIVSILTGSIGIWASSFSRRSSASTAIAYGVVLLIVVGTYAAVALINSMAGDVGYWIILLRFNPVATFYEVVTDNADVLTYAGLIGQFALSGLFMALAVKNVEC